MGGIPRFFVCALLAFDNTYLSPLQSVHRKPWNVHRDARGALLHITVTGIERLKVCRVRLNSSYGQKQVGNQIEPPPIW